MLAVITGVAGQDGSYLAEMLLDRGYQVVGVTRRKAVDPGRENLAGVLGREAFTLVEGDVADSTFVGRLLTDRRPHEYYNLAAQSHVGHSFAEPLTTFAVNAQAVLLQLELIRQISPFTRFYQASTSEMFGGIDCPAEGYDEGSPFHPRSPYAVAKVAAYHAVVNYREAYDLHASNGILFNHSSPRRGLDFATRKISRGIASVKRGLADAVHMGDLTASRDEGSSPDYMRAAWKMLQQDEPGDYVVATGVTTTIEEMFRYVCTLADLDFEKTYRPDERFLRPSDVPRLVGNATRARDRLDWQPECDWRTLLCSMYENDLAELAG